MTPQSGVYFNLIPISFGPENIAVFYKYSQLPPDFRDVNPASIGIVSRKMSPLRVEQLNILSSRALRRVFSIRVSESRMTGGHCKKKEKRAVNAKHYNKSAVL